MAVDVLADMFTSSLLDADEFEAERGVILEELAMADDDPSDVVSERLFEAVFGDHPLGRPIGGSPESITAVDRGCRAGRTTAPTTARRIWSSRSRAPSITTFSWRGSPPRSTAAGWDLVVAAAPRSRRRDAVLGLIDRGSAARRREAPDRAGQPAARRRRAARHRRPPRHARRAQLGARRRDVVAPVPRDPREARPGVLGLLVRRRATPTPGSSGSTRAARRRRPRRSPS